MRNILILLFVSFMFSFSGRHANAQGAYKAIIEHFWKGYSTAAVDFTKSGKVRLEQTLSLTLHIDNTISGSNSTTLDLDGVKYIARGRVSGRFYPSYESLYISVDSWTDKDPLPNDLRWCKAAGTLTFYNNSKKRGGHILKGTLKDDCGGSNTIEYLD